MKVLRIAFTWISAIFIAAVVPVGALVNWGWAVVCGLCAFLFYGLMLLCKQKQEEQEKVDDTKEKRSHDTEQTETEEEKDEK